MKNEKNNKEYNFISKDRKDYSVVTTPARIAVYDDLKSPPRILEISPDATNNYIENLASTIYDEVVKRDGKIPYNVIREISENFIHASFTEIVVSILDNGQTVRFSDQGPGFRDIQNAQLPGFSSATEGMKQYIRGVGSGLPSVKEYLKYSEGYLKIENNLDNGAVVTVSVMNKLEDSYAFSDEEKSKINNKEKEKLKKLSPSLNDREKSILKLLFTEGALGVSDISNYLEMPVSSAHKALSALMESELVEQLPNKKRVLSKQGFNLVELL